MGYYNTKFLCVNNVYIRKLGSDLLISLGEIEHRKRGRWGPAMSILTNRKVYKIGVE